MKFVRRIGAGPRLCNAAALVMALGLTVGCKDDPPPVVVEDAAAAEVGDGGVKDAEPRTTLPVPPAELLQRLPAVPPPLQPPGTPIKALRSAHPTLKPSPYTTAMQTVRPAEGAFRMLHYQLDKKREKVVAVLATFHAPYAEPDRKALVKEMVKARLGKGRRTRTVTHDGQTWRTLDYRIELRTDRRTKDLEIMFHSRGARVPGAPE